MNRVDGEVVRAAAAGDATAIARLLEICQPDLRRFARRTCRAADVDDAVQEALWAMYRRVGALRVASALAGYLFTVVRRACLRMLRRATPRPPEPGEVIDGAALLDLRADLAAGIAALPHEYRNALVLRDVRGLSSVEAAAALGISSAALKSRLHRARAAMREQLSAYARV